MADRLQQSSYGILTSLNEAALPALCLYRGRRCFQPRAMKPNGELHRLCRRHRIRHNQYQRDSLQRRRGRATAEPTMQTRTYTQIDLDRVGDPAESDDGDDLIDWLLTALANEPPTVSHVEYWSDPMDEP